MACRPNRDTGRPRKRARRSDRRRPPAPPAAQRNSNVPWDSEMWGSHRQRRVFAETGTDPRIGPAQREQTAHRKTRNVWSAARYVGDSTATGVSRSMNNFATRSMPCWEPETTRTCSASQSKSSSKRSLLMRRRNARSPSVVPYCSAACGTFTSRTGKVSGQGSPPANEIMPGRLATERTSRIGEGCRSFNLEENLVCAISPPVVRQHR